MLSWTVFIFTIYFIICKFKREFSEKVNELSKKLNEFETSQSSLQAELSHLKSEYSKMESCNVNLKISLDELTSQKSSLEKESDDLKKVNLRAPLFFSTQYLKLDFNN